MIYDFASNVFGGNYGKVCREGRETVVQAFGCGAGKTKNGDIWGNGVGMRAKLGFSG